MTQIEREELADRLNDLDPKELKKFLSDESNMALTEAVLQDIANTFTHKSGRFKGKPEVGRISRILNVSKGGTISDALKGERNFTDAKRVEMVNTWAKISNFSDARIQKIDGVNSAGRFITKKGTFA